MNSTNKALLIITFLLNLFSPQELWSQCILGVDCNEVLCDDVKFKVGSPQVDCDQAVFPLYFKLDQPQFGYFCGWEIEITGRVTSLNGSHMFNLPLSQASVHQNFTHTDLSGTPNPSEFQFFVSSAFNQNEPMCVPHGNDEPYYMFKIYTTGAPGEQITIDIEEVVMFLQTNGAECDLEENMVNMQIIDDITAFIPVISNTCSTPEVQISTGTPAENGDEVRIPVIADSDGPIELADDVYLQIKVEDDQGIIQIDELETINSLNNGILSGKMNIVDIDMPYILLCSEADCPEYPILLEGEIFEIVLTAYAQTDVSVEFSSSRIITCDEDCCAPTTMDETITIHPDREPPCDPEIELILVSDHADDECELKYKVYIDFDDPFIEASKIMAELDVLVDGDVTIDAAVLPGFIPCHASCPGTPPGCVEVNDHRITYETCHFDDFAVPSGAILFEITVIPENGDWEGVCVDGISFTGAELITTSALCRPKTVDLVEETCLTGVKGVLTDACTSEPVDNTSVSISSACTLSGTAASNAQGEYDRCLCRDLHDYIIDPSKNIEHLYRVSTRDLVVIQRHLLGINEFGEVYQYIAADVNGSGNISAADISTLRKLILGATIGFPNGVESWTFVDADDYALVPMAGHAYDFIHSSGLDILDVQIPPTVTDADFIGVKMGDVSCPVNSPQPPGEEGRIVSIDNYSVSQGQVFQLDLDLQNPSSINAFQMAIQYSTEQLELFNILPANLDDLTVAENFYTDTENGVIQVSWNDLDLSPIESEDDQNLFTVQFVALGAIANLSEVIDLNTEGIASEAYDVYDNTYPILLNFNASGGGLNMSNNNSVTLFESLVEAGNELYLEFKDYEGKADFRLFDISGREWWRDHFEISQNENNLVLDIPSLHAGLYFLVIETDDGIEVKKIIR